jgi:hypothetical protein
MDGVLTEITNWLNVVGWGGRLWLLVYSLRPGRKGRKVLTGSHTFRVPHEKYLHQGVWCGAMIQQLLEGYHIGVWGGGVTARHIVIDVANRQAGWAEWLMLRAGIRPDGPLFDPGNAHVRAGSLPPRWAERNGRKVWIS